MLPRTPYSDTAHGSPPPAWRPADLRNIVQSAEGTRGRARRVPAWPGRSGRPREVKRSRSWVSASSEPDWARTPTRTHTTKKKTGAMSGPDHSFLLFDWSCGGGGDVNEEQTDRINIHNTQNCLTDRQRDRQVPPQVGPKFYFSGSWQVLFYFSIVFLF